MSVELIDKIKPKNNGTFPLVDAVDVLMPDGSRLSTWQGGDQFEIPTIDLSGMGLPAIPDDGSTALIGDVDISEIMTALEKGIVKFKVDIESGGEIVPCEVVMTAGTSSQGLMYWGSALMQEQEIYIHFWNDSIMAYMLTFKTQDQEIPTFDLATLGLPAIPLDGSDGVVAEGVALSDVNDIMTALDKGPVKFTAKFAVAGSEVPAEAVMSKISVEALRTYICAKAFDFEGTPMILNLVIMEGTIVAYITLLATDAPHVTSINMSEFDSAGKIVETYEDGNTKTTTITFDESGNPVKITDSDGNETTLTW